MPVATVEQIKKRRSRVPRLTKLSSKDRQQLIQRAGQKEIKLDVRPDLEIGKTAGTTQAIPTEETPSTIGLVKGVGKFLDPRREFEVRPAFGIDEKEVPFGGGVAQLAIDVPARVLEAPERLFTEFSGAVQDIAAGIKSQATGKEVDPGEIKAPFLASGDLRRLGIEPTEGDKSTADPLGTATVKRKRELDQQKPDSPQLNSLQAFSERPLMAILDAIDVGAGVSIGAKALLRQTAGNKATRTALKRFGLTVPEETTADTMRAGIVQRARRAAKRAAKKNDPTIATNEFRKIKEDLETINEAVRATKAGEPEVQLNALGDFLDRFARNLVGERAAQTGRLSRVPQRAQAVPRFDREALPGTRRRPGQAQPAGLSTEEVENVGRGVGRQADDIPEDLRPLAKEARKFDSAEEFVEGQLQQEPKVTLYRASKTGKVHDNIKDFAFFATNKDYAKQYATRGEKIVEYNLPESALLRDSINTQEVQYLVDRRNPKIAQLTDIFNRVKGAEEAEPTAPRRIQIDAELKEIRSALRDKAQTEQQIGELETRLSILEESVPDVSLLRRVAGKQVENDTISQIQATAQKQVSESDFLKGISLSNAEKILRNPKSYSSQEVKGARIVRRAHLDELVTEEKFGGYRDLDEADDALSQAAESKEQIKELKSDLKEARATRALANKAKVVARPIKKETMAKAKAIYDKKVAKIKDDKEILARRRNFIKAVKEQFGLSDADLKKITGRDIRLMSNAEFKQYLDRIRELSEKLAEQRQARNELLSQIKEKEINIEPLRKAMKLPKVANMNVSQLREFDELLQPYMKGDVFLSKRALETIDRTELTGLKTHREIRDFLLKKLKEKDYPEFRDLSPKDFGKVKISELDRFKGFSGLAEKDPFFRMIVEEVNKARLVREAEYLQIEKRANKLARKMKTTLLQKIIPQQKNISRWFKAENKKDVELTPEETALVKEMQKELLEAKDYLIKMEALNKGISSDRYYPHIRRNFLEAVKEDGVIQAFKEVFNQYKLDEQAFGILDGATGEVLANDKFFRFALHRSGNLIPTENILRAYLTYMKTFKTKQALDEMTPTIMAYSNALTPKGTTEEGLLLHGQLVKFVKEWLNTQKGRRITLLGKQGGKIDWGLRALRTFTTLMDLGGNIATLVATQLGEQAISYQLLGKKKSVLAKVRAVTPRGRRIRKKYQNVIGKNPWGQLIEPMRSAGDRFSEGLFVLFRDANVRRNRNVLLGSMSKAEWKAEELSPESLAKFQISTGRYGVMDGAGSVVGATPEVGAATQYKTWAIPIVSAQARNTIYLSKWMASRGKREKFRGKRAALEFYRLVELGSIVTTIGAFTLNEDDDSFFGKLYQRAYQEALTLYGAGPSILTTPRIVSFLDDLSRSSFALLQLERYKTSRFGEFEEGDLKGSRQLQRLLLIPRAVKQFEGDQEKTIADVKAEIKEDIDSGELSVSAAKEKFVNEAKKLERAQTKKRFELPLDKYKADVKERLQNEELTVAEAKEEFVQYLEKNVVNTTFDDEKSFIDWVTLYKTALGTDFTETIALVAANNRIRKIENGALIIERNATFFKSSEDVPVDEKFSQQVRSERGATDEMVLDHTIPIQLGGLDKDDNVKLVSVDEWASYTPVENHLGDKMRAGLISKEEARDLLLRFKQGELTAEEIME